MKPSFLIAAPSSGSGKTTIARGLMALGVRKGLTVQPFKCGPDYIDTKFHEAVCGRPSVNLDTFMASAPHVRWLFEHYGADADLRIVEGMMGLFDGYDRDLGSTAEIARVLGVPVVLVADARSAAYSMAALLSGFIHFRDDVTIGGVIFNKVGSARHFEMLREVCSDLGIACLGYLPKRGTLEQGSRYLGLDFSAATDDEELVSLLEEHVDWDGLLALSSSTPPAHTAAPVGPKPPVRPRRLVMARNSESFSFVYQEMVDRYAEVSVFDPETELPSLNSGDLLYLPGGYPEKHLQALEANIATRHAIKAWAESGGEVLAECGGMMYLCQSIVDDAGPHPMCGVLPYTVSARSTDRKLSLGYRRFELDGREYRGHEFHYTQFAGAQPESAAQVYNARGQAVSTPVMRWRNVLASYTHLYPL